MVLAGLMWVFAHYCLQLKSVISDYGLDDREEVPDDDAHLAGPKSPDLLRKAAVSVMDRILATIGL